MIFEENVNVVGRIYMVNLKGGVQHYLSLLSLHVSGAISFEALRMIDGKIFETYRETCWCRELLPDDAE